MALRLEIISSQRQQLGPRASIVLGPPGGSVGRAADNDWALPDEQRYLSGHHARFHCRHDGCFLEDTSANGVFINNSTKPQGPQGMHELRDGDVLRMGEYQIRVHIDPDSGHAVPGALTMAGLPIDNVVPLRAALRTADDLGASLNIEALLPPAMNPAQQRLTRLRAAARSRLEGNGSAVRDVHSGMQAFCRGAGIDPAHMPMEDEAQSLHLVGRLLREALIGLKEILRAQQAFRDSYGLDSAKPGQSQLEQGTAEYLQELLAGHEQHRLDAVMQLRGHFAQAGAHDAALDPALRGALTQFMEHLSPARLESGSGNSSAETNWARYRNIYGNLLQTSSDKVPHLFLEAIAQSYPQAAGKRPDQG